MHSHGLHGAMEWSQELLPLLGYFLLILVLLVLISPNFLPSSTPSRRSQVTSGAASSSATCYLGLAILSLGFTWTYMFKYFQRSFEVAAARAGSNASKYTAKEWLASTSLFVEAWHQVGATPMAWWWSQVLCAWTAGPITGFWYFEGQRHRIRRVWAFMLLGQVVAISFAQNLFFLALALSPPTLSPKAITTSPLLIWSTLLSFLTIALVPSTIHKPTFLPNLLLMHILLLLPLLPGSTRASRKSPLSPSTLYLLYSLLSLALRYPTYLTLPSSSTQTPLHLLSSTIQTLSSHPAQSSISYDVIFAFLSMLIFIILEGKEDRSLVDWIGVVAIAATTPFLGIAATSGFWLAKRERRIARRVQKGKAKEVDEGGVGKVE
ncbi:BZ3500_MvSof-1268-A1-R1_Chr6-2g08475 [Microbotryum saponariae]|uniref:BZ3500_MvSof-1268-A1-R1_Chr6-2g08475 protein n=1 Tax=Microbotryum saponariae TaxID=289078 RepID=A0A2X0NIJ8_9BASI|nr:BZ3500_MvSof-1268-A1-R1_Chr6-2g08475 [Microbotryum saponariae]SDA07752.1 BZ3501_MvSof-1269-A2-R1_Chr6-1g08189 [Microbotryum saponariae]